MTTKTLTSAYPSGYTLKNSYNALYLKSTASVGGSGVTANAYASVENAGTIAAGASQWGVYLKGGGAVSNYSTIAGFYAVRSAAGGPAITVINSGTMIGYGNGVVLSSGGYVGNSNYGTIIGGGNGVVISGGSGGTVVNSGIIYVTYVPGVTSDAAVNITTGSVQNYGSLSGIYGVQASGVTTVVNYGVIRGATDGVLLGGGGVLTNGSQADTKVGIYGYNTGVAATGAVVSNFGTIGGSATIGAGVTLGAGSSLTNGAVTDFAEIKGYSGVTTTAASAAIHNFGEIIGLGTASGQAGVVLAGGHLINGSGVDTAAFIQGVSGVTATAGGAVANYGFIDGAGLAVGDYGIRFTKGGALTNGSGGDHTALVQGYTGVAMSGGAGTITNFATIRASGGSYHCVAVTLVGGGVVTNGSTFTPTAQIVGYSGVLFGAAGTVNNYGTVSADDEAVGFSAAGALRNGAGTDQAALITGYIGVFGAGALAATNFGTIRANGFAFGAVTGNIGASVTNGSGGDDTALLAGAWGVRIDASGAQGVADLGSVANYGTIKGSTEQGVLLSGGGVVTNGSRASFTARIDGYGGVAIVGAAGTIFNYATIDSGGGLGHPAITLAAGGRVVNGFGSDTAARVSGVTGVDLGAAGTVVNFATIDGQSGYGVVLRGGGAVTNGGGVDRSALIQGYIAIEAKASATVKNFGTVISTAATRYGVYMAAGGTLTNGSLSNATALIEGAGGVALETGGAISNFATLWGAGDAGGAGVYLYNGASLTNGAAGDPAAVVLGYTGVHAHAAATVTNFGTILGFGGVAIEFDAASDMLAVEAGATFIGSVNGGGGTLDLASGSGAITSLLVGGKVTETGSATTFANFGTLEVGAGASFTVSGSGTIAAGQGLIVAGTLTEAGTLTIAGSLTTTGTLAGTGTLALTGGTSNFNTGTALTIAKVTQSGGTANSGSTTLTYAGVWTQTVGTVSAATGDKFSFSGAGDTFAGTLAGAGTIAFTGGTDALTGTTLKAASMVINGGAVTLTGTIANTSVVTVTSPNVVVAAAGVTLTGAGSLVLSNSTTSKIVGASSSATLTNAGNKIFGAGVLGGGLMKLVNQAGGLIFGNQTTALTIDTGANTIANAGIIENTGTGGTTIASAVANTGTLMVTKGVLTVTGAVSGAGTVKIAGGTADFTSTFAENVAFTSTTGVLELAKSQSYTGSVGGFSKTGTTSLDLLDIGFVSGTTKATYSGTTASGTLTVTDGTHTAKIAFTGDYTAAVWTVSSDGHGGTTVVDPTKSAITQPRAPTLPFIAAMARFGAPAAALVNAAGATAPAMATLLAPRPNMA